MDEKSNMEQRGSIRRSSRMNGIDFSLYQTGKGYKSKCEPDPNNIIKECKYLFRLTTASKYYNILKTTDSQVSQDIFVQFCTDMYVDLLDDIAHFHSEHGYEIEDIETELIKKYAFKNCAVTDCVFTNRHYDEKRELITTTNGKDPQYIFYEQIMDALHFNLFHLHDVGLRCKLKMDFGKNYDEDEHKYNLIDEKFGQLKEIIHNKRKRYSNERFSARDSKYNISIGFSLNGSETQPLLAATDNVYGDDNTNVKKKNVWNSLKRTVSRYLGNDVDQKSNENIQNLNITEMELTWTDNMWKYMMSHGVDKNKIVAVRNVFYGEEYDTDSVIEEFNEEEAINPSMNEERSNVRFTMLMMKEPSIDIFGLNYNLAKSGECVLSIQDYIKNTKLCSFNTGLTFWYWAYYHPAEINKRQKKHKEYDPSNFNINDYGGYKMNDLYIDAPIFKDLKDEIINSGYVSMKQFIDQIELPSKKYIASRKAKLCRADADGMISNLKQLHYGIKRNSPLLLVHLQAVICYCDMSKLCTSFSSTFRAIFVGETLSSIKKRNQCYYYLSKYLRECVDYFGKKGKVLNVTRHNLSRSNLIATSADWLNKQHLTEQGPFFCGVSSTMSIPSFNMRLCGPTSTSKQLEIAINFAKRDGIIIQLNNNSDWHSRNLHFFDCSWISHFKEEDERLFYGGDLRIRVESVLIIKTAINYANFFKPLFYFDCMINGSDMERAVDCTVKDYGRLNELIKHELGTIIKNADEFDQDLVYIYECFHMFCQSKTTICINLYYLDKYFNEKIQVNNSTKHALTNLFMYGVGKHNNNQNNNLFRPSMFRLFPNINQIIYYTDNDYNFSFAVFNSLYCNIDSFKSKTKIIIKTEQQKGIGNRTWITKRWKSITNELEAFKMSLIATKGYYARGTHSSAAYKHPIQILTIQKK